MTSAFTTKPGKEKQIKCKLNRIKKKKDHILKNEVRKIIDK